MNAYISDTYVAPAGFTPVRRREDTLSAGRMLGDQEQEWTTARCHRLLRALTSRVAILSKEISRYSTAPQLHEGTKAKAYEFPRSKTTTKDDDWIHPRKKVKQTYSGRGKGRGNGEQSSCRGHLLQHHNGRQSLMPGELLVSTPDLVRARGEEWAPPSDPSSPIGRNNMPEDKKRRRSRAGYAVGSGHSSWQLSGTLRDLKKKVDPFRYTTYEGIYTGLEVLIRSTKKEEHVEKRKGARSLFSMALKAVPRYISEQEKQLSEYMQETRSKCAITSRDMSTEVYDDLESLGTCGKNWKHLRTVVRSHGIKVLGDAIGEGLFEVDFCGVLVTLLVELSAIEEAETLLSALVCSSPFPKPKTLYDPLDRRLVMLGKYSEHTGRLSFQYDQLSKLIMDENLPSLWLATKGFGQIWTALIHSISSQTNRTTSRFVFLDSTIPVLAATANIQYFGNKTTTAINSAFSDASKHTFASLLTTIASIFILRTETRRFGGNKLDYEYIIPLLRTCTVGLMRSETSTSSQLVLLLLVRLIIESKVESTLDTSEIADTFLEELGQHDKFLDMSTTYEELASLVSNIARCCGRGASGSGFDYLQELHLLLEMIGCEKVNGDIFKGIIVDSAFEFSDKNSEQQHLDYASGLDTRFISRAIPMPQDLGDDRNESRSGFRWEEGIGEWVAKTPALKTVKRKLSVSTKSEESECDTPYRPAPRPRQDTLQVLVPSSAIATRIWNYDTISSSAGHSDDLSQSDSQLSTSSSDDELAADNSMNDDSSSETAESSVENSPTSSRTTISKGKHTRTNIIKAPRLKRQAQSKSQDYRLSDSSISSSDSSSSQESYEACRLIDRAPRLGKGAHRSSQSFQVFLKDDESDDELSFVSVSSPNIMRDVTNKKKTLRQPEPKQKPKKRRMVSDSEDELCF